MLDDVASPDVPKAGADAPSSSAQPDLSPVLVVSSVSLCDLNPNLHGVPCVLELSIGRHWYSTDPLMPTATEGGESCTTCLDSLHVSFPISCPETICASHTAANTTPGSVNHSNTNGSAYPHVLLEKGVHVTLRAASSGTIALGTAVCRVSDAWVPLSPCSGSVCVRFCCRRDVACGPPHLDASPRAASAPFAKVEIRHPVSATVTPTRKIMRLGWNSVPDALLHAGDTVGVLDTFAAHTPPPIASPTHQRMPARLVSSMHLTSRCTREGQPRNLVFSHFCVGGFVPLAPVGYWELEFTWPHPQLANTHRTLRIPPQSDTEATVELHETITLDLPLFLRGEVHTHLSALWRGDADKRTHIKAVFDSVRVDVQESESSETVERKQSVEHAVTELSIRLRVALEFHEPLREGHNGRPTSAYPQRRPMSLRNLHEGGHNTGNKHESAILKEDHSPHVESVLNSPPLWFNGSVGSLSPDKVSVSREVPAALWRSRNRVVCTPVTIPPLQAVQNLVPCFDEAQRRTVFDMYDTRKRGIMTHEQLLHFCRAHVAIFNEEQSDVSVLHSLWPYVPDGLLNRTYASAKASSAGGVREGSARGTGRIGSPSPGGTVSRPHSASKASTRRSQVDSVPYEVFTLIALRLSRM